MDAASVIEALDAGWSRKSRGQPRAYIGASGIGSPCQAYLALSLRGFPDDPMAPRMQRIMQMGHIMEGQIVSDLRAAGLSVADKDPMTGRQYGYEEFGGHVKAHIDGQIIHEDDIIGLEIKTMNKAKFASFVKHGIAKSHPKYEDQMQMCMGLSGIRRFMMVAYCKDDSTYHVELVDFDELEWSNLKHKIQVALYGEAARIASKPDDWRCKFCFKQRQCWQPEGFKQDEAPVSCRTCAHASPEQNGGWYCHRHSRIADEVCDQYQQFRPTVRT